MIYVYAETEADARYFVDQMNLDEFRIVGNETKPREGALYRDTDTIYILPGVSKAKIRHLSHSLAKTNSYPTVHEHLIKHLIEKYRSKPTPGG